MDKMYKAEGKLRKSNDENPINRNLFYFFFINFIEIRLKYKINF